MVGRSGIVIMLGQLETTGVMRPNRLVDPEGGAWDAYIWIDNADAVVAEFRSSGVNIVRDVCDQHYGCRDFEVDAATATVSALAKSWRQLVSSPTSSIIRA